MRSLVSLGVLLLSSLLMVPAVLAACSTPEPTTTVPISTTVEFQDIFVDGMRFNAPPGSEDRPRASRRARAAG